MNNSLPPELVAQLSKTGTGEAIILECFQRGGGTLSIDLALIALYRSTGQVWERTKLNAKLYRMSRRGLLRSVPGKKGVYTMEVGRE